MQIFTQKIVFFFLKYDWNFSDQLPVPYRFHGISMRGILFFYFASRGPLSKQSYLALKVSIFSFAEANVNGRLSVRVFSSVGMGICV